MTLTCPGPACPFCTGELCRSCPSHVARAACPHDSKERHGDVPRRRNDADTTFDLFDGLDLGLDDLQVTEADLAEPAESRVHTAKLPPATKPPPMLAARVVVEFSGNDNAEEAAIFFETLAKLIRLKRKFVVICE